MPSLRVMTTALAPSDCMSTTALSSSLAGDFESSPRWWLSDATTSFASIVLPLWNVTPWRRVNFHVMASAVSIPSANSGIRLPSWAISVRLFREDAFTVCM